jgi:ribosomal protein L7/L12
MNPIKGQLHFEKYGAGNSWRVSISEKGGSKSEATQPHIRDDFEEEIKSIARSNKIEAIKRVRACTGWDLQKSKSYIDSLEGK